MRANPAGWTVAAFLMLLGASMVVEPVNAAAFAQNVVTGIRNFELQGRWQTRKSRRAHVASQPPSAVRVRAEGCIIIVAGLLLALIS